MASNIGPNEHRKETDASHLRHLAQQIPALIGITSRAVHPLEKHSSWLEGLLNFLLVFCRVLGRAKISPKNTSAQLNIAEVVEKNCPTTGTQSSRLAQVAAQRQT